MRFLTVITLIIVIILLYSCEGRNQNPEEVRNIKKESHSYSYEGSAIYLNDLGVSCYVPFNYNFLDTNELNQVIDSLGHTNSDFKILLEAFEEIKNNKLTNSYFQDTTNLMNCILFSGFKYELIDESFLSNADSIIIHDLTNLKNPSEILVTKIQNKLIQAPNITYGKIMHSYTYQGLKWYAFYYFVPGENMLLNVTVRTFDFKGMDEMIENLQLDY